MHSRKRLLHTYPKTARGLHSGTQNDAIHRNLLKYQFHGGVKMRKRSILPSLFLVLVIAVTAASAASVKGWGEQVRGSA
jgi:hypothetical protein